MCFSFLLFISFVSLVVFVVMDIKGTTKELFKVLFVLQVFFLALFLCNKGNKKQELPFLGFFIGLTIINSISLILALLAFILLAVGYLYKLKALCENH